MIVKVAVAVIMDAQNKLLITRRAPDTTHGGFWEFPGGKLEANELPSATLIREIQEEVGIQILDHHFLGKIVHDYGDKIVNLFVYLVKNYHGEPSCRERQLALSWISIEDLPNYSFPKANLRIINLINEYFEYHQDSKELV